MAAEKAAHLTSTIRSYPSLFEIISQENLAESLPQALEYVVKSTAIYNPSLTSIANYFDEIYLLFDAAVQYHYINTRGGTLSEAFYGLERFPQSKFREANVAAVIVPYVKVKLAKLFERLREENAADGSQKNVLLVKDYLGIVLDIVKFYFCIMYVLRKSTSHSLLFSILGLSLTYTSPDRIQTGSPGTGIRWALSSVGNAILPILEIGSFTAQFLQWWNGQRTTVIDSLPIPEFYDVHTNMDKTKCPLCHQPRRNSTALSTSGIVYCYQCISKYLKATPKCPVTGFPSRMGNLVRIYDD